MSANSSLPEVDPFATQLLEPVTPSQLAGFSPATKLIIRDANNGSIIVEADLDTDVILDEGNFYIDPSVVVPNRLEKTDRTITCPYKGSGHWLDLVNDHARVRNAAWVYTDTNPDYEQFRHRIGFYSRSFRGTKVEVVAPQTNPE